MRNIYLINKERSGKTYRTKINDASTDNSPAKVTGTITEEIGSIGSIEMYVYANNPGYNVIKPYSSRILATDQQGNPIFFGRVLRVTPEFSASGFGRKVICESMIGFLHDQPVPIQVFNDTIPNILNKVLGLYNKTHSDVWKFDASGIDGELLAEKHEIQSEGESLYEFISNKLFSALGLEMRVWVDGGVVANDYYQTMYIGAYVTATSVSDAITIGDNLISYQCDEDATNLCTKIVPYGSKLYTDEDNLERVTVAEVNGGDITVVGDTSVYDVCKTVIFDDIETAQELLDAAEDYLLENEEPQRTYQITAFDKHLLDPTFPAIVLGNYYMVNAPLLNINKMYLRITKRTLGIESPSNDTFTVGSAYDATSSGQIAASAADVQSLTNYTSSLEKYSTRQIRALYGEFDTLHANAVTTDTLVSKVASISTLKADDAIIKNIQTEALTTDAIKAALADINVLTAEQADIRYLTVAKANALYLTAEQADVKYLTTDQAEARYLTAAKADIRYLTAEQADVKYLTVENAKVTYLSTEVAKATYLTAETANILYLTTDRADVRYLTTDKADIKYADITLANVKAGAIGTALIATGAIGTAQIADGSITSAKIVELTADKITAGTLSVERLCLVGSDKSVIYALNNVGDLVSKNVDSLDATILTKRSITADCIVAGAITSKEIAAETITTNLLAANAVTADKVDIISLIASDAFISNLGATKIIVGMQSDISTAQSTANSATSAAGTAQTTANNAASAAKTAQTTADNAASAAKTAQSTANTASSTASAASTAAFSATEMANAANKAATSATETANSAKKTADGASGTASTAKTTADSAFSTASAAKTTADSAASTANTAKTTANSASGTANSALSELHGLYSANTTTIDGGKITTGSIKAAQINVSDLFAQAITATGSISGATITTNSGKIAGWALSSLGLRAGLTAISDTKNTGIMLSPSLGIRLNNIDNGGVFIQNSANSRINTCTIRGNYLDFSNTATAGDKAILGCYNSIYPMLSFTNSANTIETKITGASASFGGTVDFSGSLYLGNNRGIYAKDTSNTNRQMMIYNGGHNLLIGYGAKEKKAGMTTVYGNTVRMFAVTNAIFASDATNGYLYPSITGKHRLGTSTYKWQYVYATNGTIQTSDLRQKDNVQAIDERYERLYMLMQPVTYRWRNVNPDDNHDRTRIGFIAQWTKTAMDEAGLNAVDLAAYCKDPVYPTVHTSDGTEIEDTSATPIDYLYGLNYGEFIALNTHMVQKLYAKLGDLVNKQIIPMQARIAYLENQINNKTQSIA